MRARDLKAPTCSWEGVGRAAVQVITFSELLGVAFTEACALPQRGARASAPRALHRTGGFYVCHAVCDRAVIRVWYCLTGKAVESTTPGRTRGKSHDGVLGTVCRTPGSVAQQPVSAASK